MFRCVYWFVISAITATAFAAMPNGVCDAGGVAREAGAESASAGPSELDSGGRLGLPAADVAGY